MSGERQRVKSSGANKWQTSVYALFLITGIGVVIYSLLSIGQTEITSREANLLAVFLTVSSLFVSWIITTAYHHLSTSKAIRDRDVQKANGIQSIKQQIAALRLWNARNQVAADDLSRRLEWHSEHISEAMNSLDIQLDTMLKDIGGGIGDADRQAEEVLGIVKAIGDRMQELQTQKRAIEERSHSAATPTDYDVLQQQLSEITRQQENLTEEISKIANLKIENPVEEPSPRDIDCPHCASTQQVRMIGFPGETRAHNCSICNKPFNAHYSGNRSFFARPTASEPSSLTIAREYDAMPIPSRDSLSPPGFDYSPMEFRTYADNLIAIYEPNKFSLKSLGDELASGLVNHGFAKSKIQKFIQLLYWGRLFDFAKSDDQGSSNFISNSELKRKNITLKFFRSIGYRMNSVRNIDDRELQSDIKEFLRLSAPDLDIEDMKESFMEGNLLASSSTPVDG